MAAILPCPACGSPIIFTSSKVNGGVEEREGVCRYCGATVDCSLVMKTGPTISDETLGKLKAVQRKVG